MPANPRAAAGQMVFAAEDEALIQKVGAKVAGAFPHLGLVVLDTGPAENGRAMDWRNAGAAGRLDQLKRTRRVIDQLLSSGRVVYAEYDHVVRVQKTPNDPRFNELWGLHNTGQSGGVADADIDAPEAWDVRQGSAASVVVGVVDSGVDYNHPDLAGNMWKNPGETPGNGIDDDGNGYIDDVYGIDTYNNDSDPMDDDAHGTHVAGTIGARGANQQGVVGVNWYAKIMALKFLGSTGSGWSSDAIELLNYVIDMKRRAKLPRIVLNHSWGGSSYSQALYDAFKAAQDAGILHVAAAGNSYANADESPAYPAAFDLPGIISVGAMTRQAEKASFSNYGCASVDLMAPGASILSTVPNNGYASFSGTSMASPHVAGAAAMVWAQNPTWVWRTVKGALLDTVDFRDQFREITVTGGHLNLNSAVRATFRPSVFGVAPNTGSAGEQVTITGDGFGTTPGSVTIGGVTARVVSWGNQSIKVEIPAGVPTGISKVQVARPDGLRSRAGACFDGYARLVRESRLLMRRSVYGGAQVGDFYWLLGGFDGVSSTDTVERYNLKTKRTVIDNIWRLPEPLEGAAAVAVGEKIYLFGGYNEEKEGTGAAVSKKVYVFDTKVGTWSEIGEMPAPRAGATAARLSNGKIYLFGGVDSNQYTTNTTWIFDPATNSWSNGSSMPAYGAWLPIAATPVVNQAQVNFSGNVYTYSASTNQWTFTSSTAVSHYKGWGLRFSGSDYFIGGTGNLAEVWRDGKWNAFGKLPNIREFQGAPYSGSILLFGGEICSGFYCNTSRDIWKLKY